ncbi:MAG: enoyl-CoA hydratase, partial [Gammaproteobacteria bacterium]|nr:enoyl-CoA hydratase [Gammaproteobacteria bacterium]
EAFTLGLVNRIVEPELLLEETYAYVRQMIETVSPGSLRESRWQIYKDLHRDVAESVRDSERLIDAMSRQKDFTEGVNAFLEKRLPNWTGE